MSILTKILGIDQVWDGKDFVPVSIESLDCEESKIWTNLARRDESVEHQKNIRCFEPTHAIEVPNSVLYLGEGRVNRKRVLFIAPEEGWGSRVVTCHEAFRGILEEEYQSDHHWREFFRLQKLAGEF